MENFTFDEMMKVIMKTMSSSPTAEDLLALHLFPNDACSKPKCFTFDAEAVFSEFKKNAAEARIQVGQLKKDIADIVIVGLCKGNLRKAELDRFKPALKIRTQELINRYKIKIKTGEHISTSSHSMSFARSVLVFPLVACNKIKMGLYKPKITENLLFSNELPAVFKHSGFPALIPKKNRIGSVYFYAYLAYGIEFSNTINRSSSLRNVKQKFDEQYAYASNGWEGKFIGFEERVEAMKMYEINTRGVLETCLKVENKLLSEVGKDIFDPEKMIETYVDGNDVVNFELVDEGDHE